MKTVCQVRRLSREEGPRYQYPNGEVIALVEDKEMAIKLVEFLKVGDTTSPGLRRTYEIDEVPFISYEEQNKIITDFYTRLLETPTPLPGAEFEEDTKVINGIDYVGLVPTEVGIHNKEYRQIRFELYQYLTGLKVGEINPK